MTLLVTSPPSPERPKKGKPGRKTNLERARIKHAEAEELRRLEREAKRATPIDPLRTAVLVTALVISGVILGSSAVFSFATIAAVAEWMQPSWPWLVWLVPGFVELLIVFSGIDAIISQARGKQRDSQWALFWMFLFSGVAVVGNAAHTIAGWADLSDWRAWVGTVFSALAPLAVVLVTKRVSKMVFANPDE